MPTDRRPVRRADHPGVRRSARYGGAAPRICARRSRQWHKAGNPLATQLGVSVSQGRNERKVSALTYPSVGRGAAERRAQRTTIKHFRASLLRLQIQPALSLDASYWRCVVAPLRSPPPSGGEKTYRGSAAKRQFTHSIGGICENQFNRVSLKEYHLIPACLHARRNALRSSSTSRA
jgi:hypothetical protein